MIEPRKLEPAGGNRRGVYLLPNLFTTAALFAGFYAIVAAIDGNFQRAGMAVFVAMLLDGMDGRVARLTSTESDFGKEYDSLSDMVSFGLAPALVVYQWGVARLSEYGVAWGRLGWLAAFLYAVTAALRLARFNTRVARVDKRFFEGLPSPSAAALVAGLVWVGTELGINGLTGLTAAFVVTAAAGLLMVSRIPYYSFKELNLGSRVPFTYVLIVPLIFMLISLDPPSVLFLLFLGYALSGPAWFIWRFRKRRPRPSASGDADHVGD
ncbi:MAG: CDP-diacylglycerol--serine O-phosphatidyltransferase [Gammaproteobacteria bacterium]